MCNEHRFDATMDQLIEAFSQVDTPLRFEAGLPNLEPRPSIRITERSPVVRPAADGAGRFEEMRWSWPGPSGKPVYNFRSEGRRFAAETRCLVLSTGFYEFTDPEPGQKRKTKWRFTLPSAPLFAIAGVVRAWDGGEAFSMLTCEPGPDIAPFHSRQVAVLPPLAWKGWLNGQDGLLGPAPAGQLTAAREGP